MEPNPRTFFKAVYNLLSGPFMAGFAGQSGVGRNRFDATAALW